MYYTKVFIINYIKDGKKMRFCTVCSNMYYITIKKDTRDCLSYYCRSCGNVDEEIDDNVVCVLDTQIKHENPHFDQIVNKYTKFDPTLPRIFNVPCPNNKCVTNQLENPEKKTNEVLYMRYNDNELKYLYMCCNCDYIWNR